MKERKKWCRYLILEGYCACARITIADVATIQTFYDMKLLKDAVTFLYFCVFGLDIALRSEGTVLVCRDTP